MNFIIVTDPAGNSQRLAGETRTASAPVASPVPVPQPAKSLPVEPKRPGRATTIIRASDLSARPPQPASATSSTTGQANRRWAARTPLDKTGQIGAGSDAAPMGCIVRNIAKHGALIELTSSASSALPECFTLVFFNNRVRSEVNCIIRWRNQHRVGVAFAGAVRSSIASRTGN